MEMLVALAPSSPEGMAHLLEDERQQGRGMAVHRQGMRLSLLSLSSLSSLMSLTSLFVRVSRNHGPWQAICCSPQEPHAGPRS